MGTQDIVRGFAVVALDNVKNSVNVGGAVRAARCYGATFLVMSGRLNRVKHPAAVKGYRHLPVIRVPNVFDALPYDCVPVAVEFIEGARLLPGYVHPERAFYVFGAEDSTLDKRILGRCRDVIMIPTARCMNLAATVNVVLYDRMAKMA